MSPEHADSPLPPVAGWSPAATSALPVLHAARHTLAQPALGLQGDERVLRALLVALLQRRLNRAKFFCVHWNSRVVATWRFAAEAKSKSARVSKSRRRSITLPYG